jgi:mannose-1-phosphate guanylyltransferase/mannose-6-phosphate isomerase
MKLHPIVLCGGSGSRLWPLSRDQHPKQLLALLGGRSLLQETVLRLEGLADVAAPVVVSNAQYRFLIAEQMREIGKMPCPLLLEPAGRNTAPALTLAALRVLAADPEGLLLAMPADHAMTDAAGFRTAVGTALGLAAAGRLVTFGVVPDAPETGYGYIRRQADGVVAEFVEKPDLTRAEGFLASGDYLWNSGIFLMRASRWIEELRRYRPDILQACEAAITSGRQDQDFFHVGACFHDCPGDSIDYAVMERTEHASVVPLAAGWSDVGAWSALWEIGAKDEDGNVVRGDVIMQDSQDNLILADNRLVAVLGVRDLVVVETKDAVLVAHRAQAQEVKELVTRLKAMARVECTTPSRVWRPWGFYETLDNGARFQVKRIMVRPGAALSLQMHHHRAEHWVVVKGTARVVRDHEQFLITENQSTYIPVGVRHRLENPGLIPLEMIEVQSGSYLGEDDITRFEDIYRRMEPSVGG